MNEHTAVEENPGGCRLDKQRATVRQVAFRADDIGTLLRCLTDWLDTDETWDVIEDVVLAPLDDGTWSVCVYFDEVPTYAAEGGRP